MKSKAVFCELTKEPVQGYPLTAPAKSGAGIGISNITGGHAASCGFFTSKAWQVLMGGPCGASSDAPVPVAGMPTRTVSLTLIGIEVAKIQPLTGHLL